jgi:hypothetical protein
MDMLRTRRGLAIALLLAGLAGCTSLGPAMREPPALIPANSCNEEDQNPIYVPPLPYGKVFETMLRVLNDYDFEILDPNRYDGRIEAVPRVSPGLLELFRPGSPDVYDRLLATFQTYRHRISIVIQPANNRGYFVEVIARKELEDLAKPIRSTIGGAIFRPLNDVDRQFEVIDSTFFEPNWFFKGRDVPLEQELIRRIKKSL